MFDNLRILLVDDDAADRAAVNQSLQRHGRKASVHEVVSCREATEVIRSGRFDCVLLDYDLPDGSGLSCLIAMREAGVTTPIVLLTRDGEEDLAVDMIKAGATDYLPKSDITSRLFDHCLRRALRFHEAQEQVRLTQEELRLRDRAIAAASNGIVICDPHQPDCPIIYCNPAFTSITGYSRKEALGRNCRFLQGEDTDDQYVQVMRDCLHDEKECQVILRNHRKDGKPWWNELTISPVRDASGALTHYVGVMANITERRDAEDALKQNVARQHALVRDLFASVTGGKLTLCHSEEDLPAPLVRFIDPILLSDKGGIRELRHHAARACRSVGINDIRCDDLETAVGEAAMNAVVHASTGIGHVFADDSGTVQVRVEDSGRGIAVADLPNATLRAGYSTAGTMGHGFKMILKTVDRVHLLTRGAGTTVVIEQDRDAPSPGW